MLTETYMSNDDAIEVLRVLEKELNQRIKHGDGEIDALRRAIVAIGEADRIVIGDNDGPA